MCALRGHGRVLGNFGGVRGSGEFGNRGLTDVLQRGGSEIARITDVKRRSFERLVNDVDARTQLVFVYKRILKIEAATEIDCQLLERFPFILQIKSVKITILAAVIDDAQRAIASLIAIGIGGEN